MGRRSPDADEGGGPFRVGTVNTGDSDADLAQGRRIRAAIYPVPSSTGRAAWLLVMGALRECRETVTVPCFEISNT